jgi:hypothetical protein
MMITTQTISRADAREIINQLKSGSTPLGAAHYLDVGRDKWYRGMNYYFESAEDGESKVRFIRGNYGDGKTHMMGMAQYFALQRGFAVSYISAENTKFDKIEEIYKGIVKNLQSSRGQGGLEFLLKDWQQKTQNVDSEVQKLRSITGLDINFRTAVEDYLYERDLQHQDMIVKWLLGEPVKLPELGINRYLRAGDSRDLMRSMSIFLRFIGYNGLLVLVDELDRIQYLRDRVRQNCYQILRELMDNTDGHGGMQGTLFYCAAPSEMFTQEKGFKEYDALRTRIETAMKATRGFAQGQVDYRGTIIDLEQTRLQRDDFYEIAKKVRNIHSVALNWDASQAFSDGEVKKLVDQIIDEKLSISTPRLVATAVAIKADITEQGQSIDSADVIKKAYDISDEARTKKHRQQYED